MKLTLEPKRLALGDVRTVTDAAGQVRYRVKGRRTLRGRRFCLYAADGVLLAQIYRPKPPVAFTHTRYTVCLPREPWAELWEDGPYRWRFAGPEWTAEGTHREAAFCIRQQGIPLLRAVGRRTYWGTAYELELSEAVHPASAIACGLALICVFENQRRADARRKAGAGKIH